MFTKSLEFQENSYELLMLCLENPSQVTIEIFQRFASQIDYFKHLVGAIILPGSKKSKIKTLLKVAEKTVRRLNFLTLTQQQKLKMTEMMFDHDLLTESCISNFYLLLFRQQHEFCDFYQLLLRKLEDPNQAELAAIVCANFNSFFPFYGNLLSTEITDEEGNILETDKSQENLAKKQFIDIQNQLHSLILNSPKSKRLLFLEAYTEFLKFAPKTRSDFSNSVFASVNKIIKSGIPQDETSDLEESTVQNEEDFDGILHFLLRIIRNNSFDLGNEPIKILAHLLRKSQSNYYENAVPMIFTLLKDLVSNISSITEYEEFLKSPVVLGIKNLIQVLLERIESGSFKFSFIETFFTVHCTHSRRASSLFAALLMEKPKYKMNHDDEFLLSLVLKHLGDEDDVVFYNYCKIFVFLLKTSQSDILKRLNEYIPVFLSLFSSSDERVIETLKIFNVFLDLHENFLENFLPALADGLRPLLSGKNTSVFLEVAEAVSKIASRSKSLVYMHVEKSLLILTSILSFNSNNKNSVLQAIKYTKVLSKIILVVEKKSLNAILYNLHNFAMKYVEDWKSNCSLLGFDILNSLIQVFPERYETLIPFFLDIVLFWFRMNYPREYDSQKQCAVDLFQKIGETFPGIFHTYENYIYSIAQRMHSKHDPKYDLIFPFY